MAVEGLPGELPKDASQMFEDGLKDLIPELLELSNFEDIEDE